MIYSLKIQILLFIGISLAGCRVKDTPDNIHILHTDLDYKKDFSLNQFCSSIELVPLETNPENLIHEIYSFIESKGYFYIFDRKQNAVFIYSNKGKLVKKILREGRGPGEYNFLDAIRINRYTGNLELLDAFGKFLIFDQTGNYIAEIRLPSPPMAYNNFEILNRDTIIFYTAHTDITGNVLRLYSRSSHTIIADFCPEITPPVVYKDVFFVRNDSVFFCRPLNNNIYLIQNDEAKVAYRWDFGKNEFKFSDELIATRSDMAKFQELVSKVACSPEIPYLFQTNARFSRYTYTSVYKDKHTINIFYDTQGTESFVFSKTTEGVEFNPLWLTDSCFVASAVPDKLPKYLNEKVLSDLQLELLKHVSEDDNPVIIKYHFKNKL